jgi:hypothetical protein
MLQIKLTTIDILLAFQLIALFVSNFERLEDKLIPLFFDIATLLNFFENSLAVDRLDVTNLFY